MISHYLKPRALTACICACLAVGAIGQQATAAVSSSVLGRATPAAAATGTQRYIVRFSEAALGLHNAEAAQWRVASAQGRSLQNVQVSDLASAAEIPMRSTASGRYMLDLGSAQAQSYRAALVARQTGHFAAMSAVLGHPVKVLRSFQLALNGAVVELAANEADALRQIDGVVSIRPVREVRLLDDVSTRLIGASSVWLGGPDLAKSDLFATFNELAAELSGKSGFKGDGVVIGDIDTGYNSASPSFAAKDATGYVHVNPLGSGNYLGDCGVTGISIAGCNDKVIGVFDEYNTTAGNAPASVEDTNGHGSHTSSTEVGDPRAALLASANYNANISGISPHSNLVFFGICPSGNGCTDAAIIGSVEDAIASQVVNVLNLSFGSGSGYEPDYWQDNQSLAFLAAAQSGIFTAQSAGNTQPSGALVAQTPGTVGNDSPWVTTVAATTTSGGVVPFLVGVTGPGTPPPALTSLATAELANDTSFVSAFPGQSTVKLPIVLSPQFDAADTSGTDGCSGYPNGAFNGAVALVSRGTCTFNVKVLAAIAAGAKIVLVADNRPESLPSFDAGGAGVPAYALTQTDALNLAAFLGGNGGQGTVSLGYSNARVPTQSDVLANFSLIGPTLFGGAVASGDPDFSAIDLIKPDIAAPGVAILAALNNAVTSGTPNGADIIGFDSGTSMASPHIAASAALVHGVQPSWSPMMIKSALMMTASTASVTEADGTTPATPFDVGAGRVSVYQATRAGLVLDETIDNLYAADPAQGGDPSTLNLASMQSSKCITTCTFTRTFTSTQSAAQAWSISPTGDLASRISASPANFTIGAGQTQKVTFTIDTRGIDPGTYRFGGVSLFPTNSSPFPLPTDLQPLHLPIAVTTAAAKVAVASNAVNIALNGQPSASVALAMTNTGIGGVIFSAKTSGTAPLTWISQKDDYGYNGWGSTHFVNPKSAVSDGYAADDFVVTGSNVDLGTIVTPGQVCNSSGCSTTLASFGANTGLHWRIYADQNGVPAGTPVGGAAAVWSYDATASSPGVSLPSTVVGAGATTLSTIALDLVAAGQHTGLAAGHYWLVVYPDVPCNGSSATGCDSAWYWDNSWYGTGSDFVVGDSSGDPWDQTGVQYGTGNGLAMTITTTATCAPPNWLTVTPYIATATAGAPASMGFTATAAGYAPNRSASAYVCFLANPLLSALGLPVPNNAVSVQVNATN